MTAEGLGTTNLWLGIIAVVSVIQILALGAVVFFAYQLYSKAMGVLENLEARHVVPLVARANHVLDEAQHLVGRVTDAENSVRDTIKHVAETGTHAAAIVRARAWPVLGLMRGVRAVLNALAARGEASGTRPMQTSTEFRGTSIPQGGSDVRAAI